MSETGILIDDDKGVCELWTEKRTWQRLFEQANIAPVPDPQFDSDKKSRTYHFPVEALIIKLKKNKKEKQKEADKEKKKTEKAVKKAKKQETEQKTKKKY